MELTPEEVKCLDSLHRYGGAEDCRMGSEVAIYKRLAVRGLVHRWSDETYITEAGRAALKENTNDNSS